MFGRMEFSFVFPVLDPESINILIKKRVSAYATDCISVDRMDSPEQTNHKLLLGNNIAIIEGLCNLEQITENPFFLAALPLKLSGREAAPARVIAIEGIMAE